MFRESIYSGLEIRGPLVCSLGAELTLNSFLLKLRWLAIILLTTVALSCNTAPPKENKNVCSIFKEKSRWHKGAKKASEKWGIPISVIMATMYQESRYKGNARPPRKKILGFLPGPRASSAYGYAQVLDETWDYYQKATKRRGADRDNFADASDFIGWYYKQSGKRNKIAANDAYHLYLSYHEGHGGFSRRTYKKKPWLMGVAKKVSKNAKSYQVQYNGCKKRLERPWWLPK